MPVELATVRSRPRVGWRDRHHPIVVMQCGPIRHRVILCCADSRVSPEHLFDAGLGELFDRSPMLREMNRDGSFQVVGFFYDLGSGHVKVVVPLQGPA